MKQKENARAVVLNTKVGELTPTDTMTSASEPGLVALFGANVDTTTSSKLKNIGATNGAVGTENDKSALDSTSNGTQDPINNEKDTLDNITDSKKKDTLTNPTLKNTKQPRRPVFPEVRINGYRKQLWPSGG